MHIAVLFADSHPTEMPAPHSEDDAKYRTLSQPLRPDRQFTTVPMHNDVFPAEDSAFDSHIYTAPISKPQSHRHARTAVASPTRHRWWVYEDATYCTSVMVFSKVPSG